MSFTEEYLVTFFTSYEGMMTIISERVWAENPEAAKTQVPAHCIIQKIEAVWT